MAIPVEYSGNNVRPSETPEPNAWNASVEHQGSSIDV